MKIVVFTSNAVRHRFLANSLSKKADDCLVVSECKPGDQTGDNEYGIESKIVAEHFRKRYETEKIFFPGNAFFEGKIIPLLRNEASSPHVCDTVKKFHPDLMLAFGSSLIKEPLLSLLKPGRFVNLHLGISPYYRGHGTNFWPFVNKELEFVGSTLLHIDAGVDTGDIIAHVRPKIEIGDNVHTVGCKVIKSSAESLVKIMETVEAGGELKRVKQFEVKNAKYYKRKDFNEDVLREYLDNLKNGLIEDYLSKTKKEIELVNLEK